ncbi:hypothetical protein M1O51_04440 [Dehalococcoidia bacterium]|nr:hypothetical protein [Dehalococcoidia bacterium]
MRRAAADKDLSENAPFQAAREQCGQLEGRIRELKEVLRSATVIDKKQGFAMLGVGLDNEHAERLPSWLKVEEAKRRSKEEKEVTFREEAKRSHPQERKGLCRARGLQENLESVRSQRAHDRS